MATAGAVSPMSRSLVSTSRRWCSFAFLFFPYLRQQPVYHVLALPTQGSGHRRALIVCRGARIALRVERKRSLHALGAELAELDAQTRGRDRGQRLRRAGRV